MMAERIDTAYIRRHLRSNGAYVLHVTEGTELCEEIDQLRDQVQRLQAMVERAAEADKVATAYQQVYFEDERRWIEERDRRIHAEVDLNQIKDLASKLLGHLAAVTNEYRIQTSQHPDDETRILVLGQSEAMIRQAREFLFGPLKGNE
jgi:hypothetical protein